MEDPDWTAEDAEEFGALVASLRARALDPASYDVTRTGPLAVTVSPKPVDLGALETGTVLSPRGVFATTSGGPPGRSQVGGGPVG